MEIILTICVMVAYGCVRTLEKEQEHKWEEAEKTDWNEYYANL